jgi:hypothetical protein
VHLNNNHPLYSHIFHPGAGVGKKDVHSSFAVEGIGFIFTLFLLAVKRKNHLPHTQQGDKSMRVEKKVHCKKVYLFYSVAGGDGGGGVRQTTAKNVWPSSPILVAWGVG